MKKIFASILFTCLLIIPSFASASTLDEVKAIIQEEYVGKVNGNLHNATSIAEVIEMLDPYSTFFTEKEFEAYIESIEMTTVGIGVVVEKHPKGIVIKEIIKGGSAQEAGLKSGQIIVSVNGQSIAAMSVDEATALIAGEKNTTVRLGILANGKTTIVTLVRKPFSIPNVTSNMLYGNVGFIHLSSFSEDAAKLVRKTVIELKNKGATSFIFDIQNNGGGYVSSAEQLIGMFPNAPFAYKLQTTFGTTRYDAVKQGTQFPKNTRVLVNRYSASASEMLAAAIADQKSAILYGEQTYGKGTMQAFFDLSDGSILKLTVGKFSGPYGSVINETGVKPHILSSAPIVTAHYDTLVSKFSNYHALPTLKVSNDKAITFTVNKLLKTQPPASSIELVQLGGGTVPIKVSQKNKQITVTPTTPLSAKSEYMLLIHPSALKGAKQQGQQVHVFIK